MEALKKIQKESDKSLEGEWNKDERGELESIAQAVNSLQPLFREKLQAAALPLLQVNLNDAQIIAFNSSFNWSQYQTGTNPDELIELIQGRLLDVCGAVFTFPEESAELYKEYFFDPDSAKNPPDEFLSSDNLMLDESLRDYRQIKGKEITDADWAGMSKKREAESYA